MTKKDTDPRTWIAGHALQDTLCRTDRKTRITGQGSQDREYLRENEKVRETVFACSYGAQVESFKQKKNGQKSRDTVPLSKILWRPSGFTLLFST